MNIYTQKIFPFLLDKHMSREILTQQRRITLADASGKILEIGFGTGLNLFEYPENVETITTIDINKSQDNMVAKNSFSFLAKNQSWLSFRKKRPRTFRKKWF